MLDAGQAEEAIKRLKGGHMIPETLRNCVSQTLFEMLNCMNNSVTVEDDMTQPHAAMFCNSTATVESVIQPSGNAFSWHTPGVTLILLEIKASSSCLLHADNSLLHFLGNLCPLPALHFVIGCVLQAASHPPGDYYGNNGVLQVYKHLEVTLTMRDPSSSVSV